MSTYDDHSIEQRLERIESKVSQIRIILLVALVVLVIGVFGPEIVIQFVGGTVFVVVIGGCIIYAGLLLMDAALKRKIGTEEERDERMRNMILESVNADDTNDNDR